MEDEVCKFWKFGFCKHKEGCKRKHFSEVCVNLSNCKNIKECPRRHPKTCKRFVSGIDCRFNDDCAYTHLGTNQNEEQNKLKEKVERLEKTVIELTKKVESDQIKQLETVVKALSRKILSLEGKVKDMKNKKDRKSKFH